VKGEEGKKAREFVKKANIDFELLDQAVHKVLWRYTTGDIPTFFLAA